MSNLPELALRSASDIGRVLASGAASPVALTEFLLSRIDAATDVFIHITADRALDAARASERRLRNSQPLSALDGVPIALKDLIDLHNPHSTTVPRVPGGSSSGSGVAVATGLAPCAIGTDTGGSVRIPASFNGITGYKSSSGRIDCAGVFALSPALDTVGPLGRSVEDCILLDMALRGAVVPTVQRRSVKGLRLFSPQTRVLDDLDAAVSTNFEASLKSLAEAGAIVERGTCDVFSQIVQLTAEVGTIVTAEAYYEHRLLINGPNASRVDRRVTSRIMMGKSMSAADILSLQHARKRLISTFADVVGDALIVMPTTAMTAPEIAPLEADDDVYHATNMKVLRNTSLGNFLDLPGLALPNGVDADGLPTSFLLSALGGDDERLLGYGLDVERILACGD